MYNFRAGKVMMLSDPKHWDHILSFLQSGNVPHRIVYSSIARVRGAARSFHYFQFRGDSLKVRKLSVSNRVDSMIDDMLDGEQQVASS
jgi:hypothetical protein